MDQAHAKARGILLSNAADTNAASVAEFAMGRLGRYVDRCGARRRRARCLRERAKLPERLKALDNVVLTPHIAANALSAQSAQQDLLLGNLAAFFAGEPLLSQVIA